MNTSIVPTDNLIIYHEPVKNNLYPDNFSHIKYLSLYIISNNLQNGNNVLFL